jgi:hypothetical protein
LRKPTNKTLEERPELKGAFESFAKESKEYFNYQLLAKSHTRFFKRQEVLVTDAEYALAKATRFMNTSKENKLFEQHKRQEDKIEKKLDDLKKELEEIDEIDKDVGDEEPVYEE